MNFVYVGSELEVFSGATEWKAYWSSLIRPHIGERVLEVGAGLGGTTPFVCKGNEEEWVCLEPDRELVAELERKRASLPKNIVLQAGTIGDLEAEPRFDTILYVDVLEHIEDDRKELRECSLRLVPAGRIIMISPAFQFLYTPFDRAVGHYRRYNRRTVAQATPAGLRLIESRYLDSVGMLASLGNKLILKHSDPSRRQIQFWDKRLVPLSRCLDPLLGFSFGRSIMAVWAKEQ